MHCRLVPRCTFPGRPFVPAHNAHILAQPPFAIIFFLFCLSSDYLCLPTMWQCPHPCSTPSCNYFSFFFFWPFVPDHNAHILAQPPSCNYFFLIFFFRIFVPAHNAHILAQPPSCNYHLVSFSAGATVVITV